jgi:hypothetical protein
MCKCFLIASSESVAPLWTAPMMMFRREPVGAAVSDGSLRTDHISSGRLGGPAAMRAESRAYRSGVPVLSAMTPTMFVPARRSRISSAMFGSEAMNALGMVPSASMANAQAATSGGRGNRA